MYKAVFLDIGGIILRIDWNKPFEYAGIFDPRHRHEILMKFQGSEILHRYERGEIDTKEFLSNFNPLMGLSHPNSFWEDAWQSLIVGELEGVIEIFDLLDGRYPVYAASNTNVLHHQHFMERFPVFKRFTKVFVSNVLGERKPDVAFYLKICKLAGVGPNEALFVDDTLENIEAAKRVGLKSQQTVNSVRETIEFLRAHLDLPEPEAGAKAVRSSRS